MNIAELRSSLDGMVAEITNLRSVEHPTDEQATQLKTVLANAEALRSQIVEAEANEKRAADLAAFAKTPAPQVDFRGATVAPVARKSEEAPAAERSALERQLAHDMYSRGWGDRKVERLFDEEYKAEFLRYLRTGEARAMNEATIADGGAVVPAEMLRQIIARRAATNRVAGAVNRIAISTDSISIPKHLGGSSTQTSSLAVQWMSENGNATEDTNLENWGSVEIRAHRGGFIVAASRSLIEDSAFDLEGWIVEQIADTYAATVDNVIINGSGVGRPFGILTRVTTGNPNVVGTTNIGNPIAASSLVGLLGTIDEQYAQNASFVMERATYFSQIASLKDSVGAFYFGTNSTVDGGATRRVESTLLGYPNLLTDHMPSLGGANNVVIFGDLRLGYTLVERVGLSIEPYYDPAFQKADQRAWYVRFRLGGDVVREYAMRVGVNS
jgi:HK97 family phage major capsid protein